MTISDMFLDADRGVRAGPRDLRGLEVSTVTDLAGFAALRAEWTRLFNAVPGQPYADPAYLDAWLGSYGAGRRIAIRIARDNGRLVGVLPLCGRAPAGARLPLAFNRIGLAGPLLQPGLAAPEAVLSALLRCGYGGYTLLEPVEAEDAALLVRAGRAAGLTAKLDQVITANAADLTGGIAAWRASLSKNARRSLSRAGKALDGDDARWIVSCDDPVAAAEAFLDVARTSWKAAGGTGFAATPQGRDFIRALARNCNSGAVDFSALYQGQTPVAASFASIKGDTMYLNAVEFNEAFAADGPGRLMMCRTIEAAAAMGLARVDMMRTSALNKSVAKSERPLFRVVLHRRGDPTVLLRRVAGLRRRLARAGLKGLSPRARHKAQAGVCDEA